MRSERDRIIPILEWVKIYLKNLPPQKSVYIRSDALQRGDRGGCAIDLLDVYGTEGTKGAKTTTFGPSKKVPTPPLNRRSKAEIEATLAFVKKHHGW